jgi:hypothetical protein
MRTRRLVFGDWNPVIRDGIDVLRLAILAGAVGFAVTGDRGAAAVLGTAAGPSRACRRCPRATAALTSGRLVRRVRCWLASLTKRLTSGSVKLNGRDRHADTHERHADERESRADPARFAPVHRVGRVCQSPGKVTAHVGCAQSSAGVMNW